MNINCGKVTFSGVEEALQFLQGDIKEAYEKTIEKQLYKEISTTIEAILSTEEKGVLESEFYFKLAIIKTIIKKIYKEDIILQTKGNKFYRILVNETLICEFVIAEEKKKDEKEVWQQVK